MELRKLTMSLVLLSMGIIAGTGLCWAQTAGTGAITGTVTDATGAVLPNVELTITNQATGERWKISSAADGRYRVPLLPPGSYRVQARKSGFKVATRLDISVNVTETTKLSIQMEVGTVATTVTVESAPQLVNTESSSLGRVVNQKAVKNLPLSVRNYTQIITLSPGIQADVIRADEVGRGRGGLKGRDADVHAHGARALDNNFQMNGVGINDLHASGQGSGGIAIPNPDTIQEFKVQTGQYDAAFGRNAGANVNVVTRGGSNEFHGTVFEFLRNNNLNANDFFFNRAGQDKPVMRQNQFGGTLGGPIQKNRWLFFTSYQGTRQDNGVGDDCRSFAVLPPLTDDRSAAAIGAMFAGRRGLLQNAFGGVGPAIAADGSNINPVALALLQLRLPDGSFLIPNPQTVDPTKPVETQGFSTFSDPCSFDEDQFMVNLDFLHTERSKFAGRYFFADSEQTATFPSSAFGAASGTLPGSPQTIEQRFQNFSLAHSYTFMPNLLNEARLAYHRVKSATIQSNPFKFSEVGITASPINDDLPDIVIGGCCKLGGAGNLAIVQDTFTFQDSVSYVRGRHALRVGGRITRIQDDVRDFRFQGAMLALTWPDFLLGLDGVSNGTFGLFSNIMVSIDFIGLSDRAWRVWDGFAYVQDDIKVTPRFTLNLGLRYERHGHLADDLGRNANFDITRANPNPPTGGTLEGFVVSENFPGMVPPGVTQVDNRFALAGKGQNRLAPRIGFAWQIFPHSSRLVLRGGYGVFYTRLHGLATFQLLTAQPFGKLRVSAAQANAAATLENPFPQPIPALSDFPTFSPITPTAQETILVLDQDWQPPIVQQWSLNVQTEFAHNFLLEVGYVGSRGTRLPRSRGLNQARLASPDNPIRGETTNTVANIPQRVPIQGFAAVETGIRSLETEGQFWYNDVEVSVTKRFSRGLQFLASYTFSRTLDTDGFDTESLSSGASNQGDQRNPRARFGPSGFSRDHRFVLSYLYELPSPADRTGFSGRLLGGWSVAGVTTFQSGQHLTLLGTNAANVFGITGDRVQLAPECTNDDLGNPGSVTDKLDNFFNSACISPSWPVIGDDGVGTDFGNSGVGIVEGPDQRNFDIAIIKRTQLTENTNIEFRAELFNAFNTPQFANPEVDTDQANFGTINETSVSPRIIQFALKINF